MTLITMGVDGELLLRRLRQRLIDLNEQIARQLVESKSENVIVATWADGAVEMLDNERTWLTELISQIERGE